MLKNFVWTEEKKKELYQIFYERSNRIKEHSKFLQKTSNDILTILNLPKGTNVTIDDLLTSLFHHEVTNDNL